MPYVDAAYTVPGQYAHPDASAPHPCREMHVCVVAVCEPQLGEMVDDPRPDAHGCVEPNRKVRLTAALVDSGLDELRKWLSSRGNERDGIKVSASVGK